jgi:hypothetical protein
LRNIQGQSLKRLKEDKFEIAVLNSLNGEQVQGYVQKGYCRRIVEDNLDHRVDEFFKRSNGTEDIIDDDDINNNSPRQTLFRKI